MPEPRAEIEPAQPMTRKQLEAAVKGFVANETQVLVTEVSGNQFTGVFLGYSDDERNVVGGKLGIITVRTDPTHTVSKSHGLLQSVVEV